MKNKMKKILTFTAIIIMIASTVCNAGRSRSYILKNSRMINGDAHADGAYHSIEIRNGQLWTWGFDIYGQLGDGNTGLGTSSPGQIGSATNLIQEIGRAASNGRVTNS